MKAAVVCWGQVCGAAELEQYPCTGGPDPNQPRNVEEEALGTMCNVPMQFWVPPASALFCFRPEENRKTIGLGPKSQSLFCNQLEVEGWELNNTTVSTNTVMLLSLGRHMPQLLFHHLMSVNRSRSGKLCFKTSLHCPLMVKHPTHNYGWNVAFLCRTLKWNLILCRNKMTFLHVSFQLIKVIC